MPKKQVGYSPFTEDLIKRLGRKLCLLECTQGKATLSLSAVSTLGPRRLNFASIRKAGAARACDVQLNSYVPEDTNLTKEQQANIRVIQATTGPYYLYRDHDIDRAVKALESHFNDIVRRVREYKKGKATRGRPKGIPRSFFK